MGLIRARGVALLIAAVLAATLEVISPASAAVAAPTVSVRQTATGLVTVSGRTGKAHPRVRFDRRTRSGWALVKRIRARHHRYATSLRVAPGTTTTFRVTSNHRSRQFRVTATPARTLYDACGARPRKADGTAWSCTYHDEFDGAALDREHWAARTLGGTGADVAYACYLDDPSTVNVGGGSLNLTVRRIDSPVSCGRSTPTNYVSGAVSTYHRFSQQYGRFEARVRTAATTFQGLHEGFWLWPDDRVPSTVTWPDAGEIDISETRSRAAGISVPFLHYSADSLGPVEGLNTSTKCTARRGVWNTYALEWTANRIAIYVNGATCLVNTSGDAAFRKPYIVAFTQALGGYLNEYDGRVPLPATMNVDYVRVWH
jgi:beta-glucanase (GH16 family)